MNEASIETMARNAPTMVFARSSQVTEEVKSKMIGKDLFLSIGASSEPLLRRALGALATCESILEYDPLEEIQPGLFYWAGIINRHSTLVEVSTQSS